jgi:hypothetical protein
MMLKFVAVTSLAAAALAMPTAGFATPHVSNATWD